NVVHIGAPKRRFEAISMMAGEGPPVEVACRPARRLLLGLQRLALPAIGWGCASRLVTDVIREVHTMSHGTYGAKRVYAELVLDAFIRRVVGCSISNNPTAAPTSNALGMAIEQREAARGETAVHSDHGTPLTSWAFTERARQSGLVPSMGSVGDCYDNAMIEAFWSRMQGGRPSPETRLHQSRGTAQPPENSGSFKLVGRRWHCRAVTTTRRPCA